jgi:hypothetical protein
MSPSALLLHAALADSAEPLQLDLDGPTVIRDFFVPGQDLLPTGDARCPSAGAITLVISTVPAVHCFELVDLQVTPTGPEPRAQKRK